MAKELKWKIDETVIVRHKYNRGRVLKQMCLFGGIERLNKRRFVNALNGPTGDKRNSATILSLIEKYIKPGSITCSSMIQNWIFPTRFSLVYRIHIFSSLKISNKNILKNILEN